jgi:tRNA-dependent cyclodipeptide synthase
MPAISVKIFPDPSTARPQPGKVVIGISLKAGLLPRPAAMREVFAWTREKLGAFSLLLGDHVNRHNYAAFDSLTEADAESRAIAEGDTAAAMLRQSIEHLPCGTAPILRASELVLAPHYVERHSRLVQQLRTNLHFRDFIKQGVDVFMTRNTVTEQLRAHVEPHCVAYQVEELAIFEILADMGYRTLVYPGPQLPVMKALASGELTKVSRALESMTLIELRVHGKSK